MSRYIGPRLKICRKLGELPGLTRKNSKKQVPPGEHGHQSKKPSEYALRLEEKQKIRFNYGINEKQLLRYIKIAKRMQGSTGLLLLQLLEMRLDSIIFRLGICPTIPAARQLVNHKHIVVNDRVVSICSYQCKPGDIIKVRDRISSQQLVKKYLQFPGLSNMPSNLELDSKKLIGKINGVVSKELVALQLNELLVVEYYSRK